MVAELEAEAAAALAAKEAELAEAQRGLDAAVASRFAQLEKQLDAKVGGGGWVGRGREGTIESLRQALTIRKIMGASGHMNALRPPAPAGPVVFPRADAGD